MAQDGKQVYSDRGELVGEINGSLFSAEGPTTTINTMELESSVTEAIKSMHTATGTDIDLRTTGKGDDLIGVADGMAPALGLCSSLSHVGVLFNKNKVHVEKGLAEAERCLVTGKFGYLHVL